jgi:hypothetical protein
MLTLDEFAGLAVGDVVECVPLFKSLSEEPVKLEVVNIATKPYRFVRFEATWFGIRLGTWACWNKQGDRLDWETT